MKAKRILVTGGAGFVGSNLCHRLIKQGHYVICLDNFYTGSAQNVADLVKSSNFMVVNHDVRQPYDFNVDEIYNLACPASPPHYQKDPVFTLETSVLGAKNALTLANKNKCKVIQASTSEVYGDALEHPQHENYWGNVNPIGLRSCYDEGKRCAETLFMDYHRIYGTRTKIVRIFNTYGPFMNPDDGRVVSNLIMQGLKNERMTIYGDGTQTRSFQYIDDLLDGMEKVMDSNDDIIGPCNIGNPHECTMLELCHKIIQLTGTTSTIEYKNLPSDDPKRRKPNISRMQKVFGWQPAIELDEGLRRTVEYFKTKL